MGGQVKIVKEFREDIMKMMTPEQTCKEDAICTLGKDCFTLEDTVGV